MISGELSAHRKLLLGELYVKIQSINTRYPFHWIDVDLGEEQLVAVVVFSPPIRNHLFDVGKIANET